MKITAAPNEPLCLRGGCQAGVNGGTLTPLARETGASPGPSLAGWLERTGNCVSAAMRREPWSMIDGATGGNNSGGVVFFPDTILGSEVSFSTAGDAQFLPLTSDRQTNFQATTDLVGQRDLHPRRTASDGRNAANT